MRSIRGAQEGPACGTGGIHQPLQLQRGDHIGALTVGVLPVFLQGYGPEPGSRHNGAVLPLLQPVPLPVINGSGGADLGADAALPGLQHGAVIRVNGGNLGHCLGKGDVNGPAGIETQVEGIGRVLLGALLRAQATAGAFGLVHIPGLVPDGHREIPHESLHRFHLGIGHNLNPLMLGRIHHFGGQDTGCAV